MTTAPQNSYPRWLSLKEAAWYSKIGLKRLVRLANDGHIKGFQDPDSQRHDWIFDRYSIDEYRENQAGIDYKKAVAIMQSGVV